MTLKRVNVQGTMDRRELTNVVGIDNIYSHGVDTVIAHLQQEDPGTVTILEIVADVLERTKEVLDTAVPPDHWSGAQQIRDASSTATNWPR